VNTYRPEPERDWSSVTVQLPTRPPGTASLGTVTVREKTSPLASGSSTAEPPRPAQLRSHVTPSPVLSGFVPDVTVAVIVTLLPGGALAGVNETLALGDVVSSAPAEPPVTNAARSAHASSALQRRLELIN
jgi:hypothetical protein